MPTEYLVGLYTSDCVDSLDDCEVTLVYGVDMKHEAHLKYVKLPCPHCNCSHNFKRELWWENLPLEALASNA